MLAAAVLASLTYFCADIKIYMRQSCCSQSHLTIWASDCYLMHYVLVGWLEFNVPFQHKYSYIRDEHYVLITQLH